MTVSEISEKLNLCPVVLCNPKREVKGGYIGDLLSWVMGRAQSGDAWITIMTNANVVAVALLADVSCIILAEGAKLDESVISIAKEKGVNILSSQSGAFAVAAALSGMVGNE